MCVTLFGLWLAVASCIGMTVARPFPMQLALPRAIPKETRNADGHPVVFPKARFQCNWPSQGHSQNSFQCGSQPQATPQGVSSRQFATAWPLPRQGHCRATPQAISQCIWCNRQGASRCNGQSQGDSHGTSPCNWPPQGHLLNTPPKLVCSST